jgi:hypothetical protein
MDFMTYLLCWYAITFGLYLMYIARNRRRSQAYEYPQEPLLALKEGETIAAVAEWPNGLRFYIEIEVVDGKSEAYE